MVKKSKIKVHELCRFMIYVLGHNPGEFGLVPDKNGFVILKELVQVMHEEEGWHNINQGRINEVMMSDERHYFEADENRIRAVERNWELNLDVPADHTPPILYTPIRRKAHYTVIERGLGQRENNYYVLSADKSMAERIGKRKDQKPVLLEIMAGKARDEGLLVFSFSDLFLTNEIPPRYIVGPPVPKDVIRKREEKPVNKKEKTPDLNTGAFFLDADRDPDTARRKKGKKKKSWKDEVRGKRRKG